MDSRTLRLTLEGGERAGYGGAKRNKGTMMRVAVDTLGHLLALQVTAPDNDDSKAGGRLMVEVAPPLYLF